MTKTLVERLREPVTDGDGDCNLREEAALEIELLQDREARLREKLGTDEPSHVHDWQPKDGLLRCSTCLEER